MYDQTWDQHIFQHPLLFISDVSILIWNSYISVLIRVNPSESSTCKRSPNGAYPPWCTFDRCCISFLHPSSMQSPARSILQRHSPGGPCYPELPWCSRGFWWTADLRKHTQFKTSLMQIYNTSNIKFVDSNFYQNVFSVSKCWVFNCAMDV